MSWPRALVCLLVLGCGGGGGDPDAAARDAPATDGGPELDIPWLDEGLPPIAIAPCPTGWSEVADASGLVLCEPYPEGGVDVCPDGEAHFPGEPTCAPVGSPCPSGDFSDELPADRNVLYVQPGATGDGSSSTNARADLSGLSLTSLPEGTVIALSRGNHAGPMRLVRDFVFRGACAAATVVSSSEPATGDGVFVARDGVGEVQDLTIASSPRNGVWLDGTEAAAVFEGVVVDDVEITAVAAVNGARLTAQSFVVRATRSRAFDGAGGRGLVVERGATAELSRAIFEANRDIGVSASGLNTAVTLSDVVIRDTDGESGDGTGGRGISIRTGATAMFARVTVERNRDAGVYISGSGTTVTMDEVIVRDTQSLTTLQERGRGLNVQDGANVVLSRALLERNRDAGVFVSSAGTDAAITDVVVRDTESRERDGTRGRGLQIQRGALATLERGLIERNRELDVSSAGAGTSLTLLDAVVRRTRPRGCSDTHCMDFPAGHGVGAYSAASLDMARFVVEESGVCGVHLANGGMLDLSDGVVRNHAIGICLQIDDYDVDRLTTAVRFVDNGVNLVSTELPVPGALEL